MDSIFTIGYQGRSIDEFVAFLVHERIQTLCDVRRKAISRKKGFSKRALCSALESAGIVYVHMPELGMPLDLLSERNAEDNSPILAQYESRITDEVENVQRLAQTARQARVCLLCFEGDHRQCHRGVLAEMLESEWQCEVRHL